MTHNSTIHKHGDTWILFYTGTCGIVPDGTDAPPADGIANEDFARYWLNKRVGIATAPHITGPWTRRNKPILDVNPEGWDADIISNAAPVIRPDGSVVLIYKSSNGRMIGLDAVPLKLGVAVPTTGKAHTAAPVLIRSTNSTDRKPTLRIPMSGGRTTTSKPSSKT